MPKEAPIGPPSLRNTFAEIPRTLTELFFLGVMGRDIKQMAPQGDHAPVLVLPGFGGSDGTTRLLRRFLDDIGYQTHGWGNGINIGPNEKTVLHLAGLIHDLHEQYGQKITLIGHSLGGMIARELAREYPEMIERVVTLGSPFGAGAHPDSSVRGLRALFNKLNPKLEALLEEEGEMHHQSLTPPPVPTTAIYTRNDGVVNWKVCINPDARVGDLWENVEVPASHVGLVVNPVTFLVIADRLAEDPANWNAFDRKKYPSSLFASCAEEKHKEYTPALPVNDNKNAKGSKILRPPSGP